ncbi:MAG: TrmB family transcriptional regulator sugar-binding domain-containing protein [Halorhabdus sp.]
MTRSDTTEHALIREKLSGFGLTEREIDTYIVLLTHGEATTRTISENTDVTQQAVYSIADRLEERGLVTVNDHASPTTIRAEPPEKGINNLTQQLESVEPALKDLYTKTEPQTPEIQTVKSRETALKWLRNAVEEASREVIVSIPEEVYIDIEAVLREAVDRGVLVVVLLGEVEAKAIEDTDRFTGAASVVRARDEPFPSLYEVDYETAMTGSVDIFKSRRTTGDVISVSEHNPRENVREPTVRNITGAVFANFMGALWPVAEEVYRADPDSLPATYDWFRHTALQAAIHEGAGTDLRAEIETVSGEHIAGPVVNIRQPFVDPRTNRFAVETQLTVDTEDGEQTVGAIGSYIEDYEAVRTTLDAE